MDEITNAVSAPGSRRSSHYVTATATEEQQLASMQRKQAQAQAAAAKRSLSVARLQEILQFNRDEELRAQEKRDRARELTDTRCRAPKRFNDLGDLSDDEIAAIDTAAVEWCERFRYFMQDLLYSMHEVFLVGASCVYLEIPQEFAEIVSHSTIAHILHKLHGKVDSRRSYLQASCPDNLNGDIAQFRQDQLKGLQEFALRGFTFDQLTTAQLLADADTQCLVFPLLPAFGLNIVREESFVVLEEVVPYVDRERCGIVYNNALKACYFRHLATLKGAKAALEMQRMTEAQEKADRLQREETQRSHSKHSSSMNPLNAADSGDDADEVFSYAHQGPPASPSLAGQDSLSTKKQQQQGTAAVRGTLNVDVSTPVVPRRTVPGETSGSPSPSSAEQNSIANDVVCPRCNTCRVCCVCGLVYGNPGTLWKPKKK